MTSLDELRQRVRAAEESFGKAGSEDREYAERLAQMVETMEGRLRDQRVEVESIRSEFDRLRHENEELRGMLLSLLLSVERGGRARLGETMQELYGRMSALAGAVGVAAPHAPPAPAAPREILPPDAGLDDLELPSEPEPEAAAPSPIAEAAMAAEPPALPPEPPVLPPVPPALPPESPPAGDEDEPLALDRVLTASLNAEDDDDDLTGIPELDALAADVTAAAAGHLSGPDDFAEETSPPVMGRPTAAPPPLTAGPSIDETARLSGMEVRNQLRASRPGDITRGGTTSGIEVKVGGDEGRPRPFERIIQRMSMAAQGNDRERSD